MKGPFSATPVKGSVFQVSGDHIASHGLFGFVESISAVYSCRFFFH